MSVPASSSAQLKGEFDRIVGDAYTTYARSHAGIMPVNRQGDLDGDLPWALTKAEFSNKVQGEDEHKARGRLCLICGTFREYLLLTFTAVARGCAKSLDNAGAILLLIRFCAPLRLRPPRGVLFSAITSAAPQFP